MMRFLPIINQILLVVLIFSTSVLTCLGQVRNSHIDESELVSFLDSITPVRIDLCKIRTDLLDQLSPENFDEFLVKSETLESGDLKYLVNEFTYRSVVGDSILPSQCFKPDYALRLYYNDGETGLIGISFSCNSIKDYNSRCQESETTYRFLNLLSGLFNKYNL